MKKTDFVHPFFKILAHSGEIFECPKIECYKGPLKEENKIVSSRARFFSFFKPYFDWPINGAMIEKWIIDHDLNHLNQSEDCRGVYTFNTKKGKSAIDHMIVNDKLYSGFKGMRIDEEKALTNLSDHCLVRAWFKIGQIQNIKCRKPIYKNISCIKRDEESYEEFRIAFKKLIGKNVALIST